MDSTDGNCKEAIKSIVADFVSEQQKLVDKQKSKLGNTFDDNHPIIKAQKAIAEVYEQYK